MRRILVSVFVVASIFVYSAAAQTNRGSIRGTITDQSGGVVENATVTITNLGTNETFFMTTSKTGTYSVSDLDPVTYRIEVEAAGFTRALLEPVKVDTAMTQT